MRADIAILHFGTDCIKVQQYWKLIRWWFAHISSLSNAIFPRLQPFLSIHEPMSFEWETTMTILLNHRLTAWMSWLVWNTHSSHMTTRSLIKFQRKQTTRRLKTKRCHIIDTFDQKCFDGHFHLFLRWMEIILFGHKTVQNIAIDMVRLGMGKKVIIFQFTQFHVEQIIKLSFGKNFTSFSISKWKWTLKDRLGWLERSKREGNTQREKWMETHW